MSGKSMPSKPVAGPDQFGADDRLQNLQFKLGPNPPPSLTDHRTTTVVKKGPKKSTVGPAYWKVVDALESLELSKKKAKAEKEEAEFYDQKEAEIIFKKVDTRTVVKRVARSKKSTVGPAYWKAVESLELSQRKAKAEKEEAEFHESLELSPIKAKAEKEEAHEFHDQQANETRKCEEEITTKLSVISSNVEKMAGEIARFNRVLGEVEAERDALRERLFDKERQVEKVEKKVEKLVLEKEELRAKVEALEDAIRRESSKLEEEYGKVEYEENKSWE